MDVAYLGNTGITMGRRASGGNGNAINVVLLDMYQALLQMMLPLSWKWYSLMAVASSSSSNYKTKCFRDGLRSKASFTAVLPPNSPDLKPFYIDFVVHLGESITVCPLLNLPEAALPTNVTLSPILLLSFSADPCKRIHTSQAVLMSIFTNGADHFWLNTKIQVVNTDCRQK